MAAKTRRKDRYVDDIREIDGAYYVRVRGQGGGTRSFWSYAGKARKDAVEILRKNPPPTKSEPLPEAVRKRIWRKARAFRRDDMDAFNREHRVAFYTDLPDRFRGKNRDNPTSRLFDAVGVRFDFIDTAQIRAGGLHAFKTLFCPGGFGYFPTPSLAEEIRRFVREGGGFVGFCAGAFWPLKDQLGLCRSTFAYLREVGFPEVLVNTADPVGRGIEATARPGVQALYKLHPKMRRFKTRIRMYRARGPLIVPRGRDRGVAFYDSTEPYAAVLRAECGKGRVIASSAHPDCDVKKMIEETSEKNVVENMKLFKNMILYAGGVH